MPPHLSKLLLSFGDIMLTLNYEIARSLIKDGDLVSVFKAHSLFNRLTQRFTGEYTHVGGALWMDGGLWLAEINSGRNHAIPLSQLKHCGFDVSSPPPGVTPESARFETLLALRETEPYGYLSAIATGVVEFFRLPIIVNWRNGRHCAGFMVRIYDRAGWSSDGRGTHSYVVSPTKLTKRMLFKFRVLPE